MVYNFFDKKTVDSGVKSTPQNEQLADELHKPIIKKFEKRKVYSAFKDNIWAADLADMLLISKISKGFRLLLCVFDIYSKYVWVVPLKDEKGVSIINAFQSILKKPNEKPNKIWIDKGSTFYNSHFKKWLKDNLLKDSLFEAVSLTKNTDIDKWKYSGYGIGFNRYGEFSFPNGLAKTCVIFGADLSSSSSHVNNKKNNILVLGKDFVQRINDTTIYA